MADSVGAAVGADVAGGDGVALFPHAPASSMAANARADVVRRLWLTNSSSKMR